MQKSPHPLVCILCSRSLSLPHLLILHTLACSGWPPLPKIKHIFLHIRFRYRSDTVTWAVPIIWLAVQTTNLFVSCFCILPKTANEAEVISEPTRHPSNPAPQLPLWPRSNAFPQTWWFPSQFRIPYGRSEQGTPISFTEWISSLLPSVVSIISKSNMHQSRKQEAEREMHLFSHSVLSNCILRSLMYAINTSSH